MLSCFILLVPDMDYLSAGSDRGLLQKFLKEDCVSIHHDDVLPLTISLMNSRKFRDIVTGKYPIILIDEYQDTNADWIESIKHHYLGQEGSPNFGFFGDHWQKIYGNGCGKIEHASLRVIGKQANFRSVSTIVDCLNRMRPDLPQFVVDPEDQGNVRVFHTNDWVGKRRTGNHWQGDLPDEEASRALTAVINILTRDGWDISADKTKILMLTHRGLASKQGYGSIPAVFQYNESFTKKEHPHISFFVDALEPSCDAYLSRRYGEMFLAFGGGIPAIRRKSDKTKWSSSMDQMIKLRESGTVGEVISHLRKTKRPRLPSAVERLEDDLDNFKAESGEEMPRALVELSRLRNVPYREVISLSRYLSGHSPFETKHGVKGAEFENVLVVVGRGWNLYNFGEMLELASGNIPANRAEAFERNRNLFYVTCSRPERRLAILFTQKLSDAAISTVRTWFGNDALEPLEF